MRLINDISYRKHIIAEINGEENIDRKNKSFKESEIYKDKILPYVDAALRNRYSNGTVDEMPKVSAINLCKRVINQEASIYKDSPVRMFSEVNEQEEETLELIYADMDVNSKLQITNRNYRLQNQTHLLVMPKNGQLVARSLKSHQLDVVPNAGDPEQGDIYILSGYSKIRNDIITTKSDLVDQEIGDADDNQSDDKIYVVWTSAHHFTMDSNGSILSEEIDNPITPLIPIIDIAKDKDFVYWVDEGNQPVDFTIDYNVALSTLGQIVDMQGFAQAYFKTTADLMPESIQIGPNHILKIVTDPNAGIDAEFGYANPQSDLAGAQAYVEALLSQFISSRGLDPKAIVGSAANGQSFSSGVERLLSLIEKFEASKSDLALFEWVEERLFLLIKAWTNVLKNTNQLDEKYKITLNENASVSVVFSKPEMIQTEQEMIDLVARKVELGFASRIDAVMVIYSMSKKEALEKIKEIDEAEGLNGIPKTTVLEEEEQSEV